MQTEIKFKLFLKGLNKMTYGHTLLEVARLLNGHSTDDFYVPLQYTGLKDTDGTDCYFDDIIKFPDDSIGVLVWFGDCLGIASGAINNYHATDQIRSYELSDCRIIGNIHEHPELLNC